MGHPCPQCGEIKRKAQDQRGRVNVYEEFSHALNLILQPRCHCRRRLPLRLAFRSGRIGECSVNPAEVVVVVGEPGRGRHLWFATARGLRSSRGTFKLLRDASGLDSFQMFAVPIGEQVNSNRSIAFSHSH